MTEKLQPPPDAFQCPYARQCWLRESVRWVCTILLTLLTLWAAGCALKLRGPGVDFDMSVPWPGASTQPIV